MSNLASAAVKKLHDLVEVLDHLRVPINSSERYGRKGAVPYYGANGLQGWIDKPLFNEPLILLAEDGGNFDDFATRPIAYRIDGPSWVNNHAHVIRAAQDVNQDFLFWALVNKDIRRFIAGGTRTKLNQSELRSIEVWIPDSQDEQRTIANILDTLDTQIRQTEAIIAKLQQVKQGLLHDLLTRGIDANGELRPPRDQAPELYQESPLGWIPREWEVKSLVELSVGGLMNGVFKEPSRVGEGVPLVNVADLYRGEKVLLENCECFDATQIERERYGARKGDIFFTRSSLKLEGIAQTSYLDVDSEDAVFECHVIRLRPNKEMILPRLLKEWCVSSYARTHFMKSAKQVTMTTISQDGIAGLQCPQPSEDERHKIVELIENNEGRLLRECALVEKLKKQKSGLMDDLLTGRVRVTSLLDTAKAS